MGNRGSIPLLLEVFVPFLGNSIFLNNSALLGAQASLPADSPHPILASKDFKGKTSRQGCLRSEHSQIEG